MIISTPKNQVRQETGYLPGVERQEQAVPATYKKATEIGITTGDLRGVGGYARVRPGSMSVIEILRN